MHFEPQSNGLRPSLVATNSLGGQPLRTVKHFARTNPSNRDDVTTIVPQSDDAEIAQAITGAQNLARAIPHGPAARELGWLFELAKLLETHAVEFAEFGARELGQARRELIADMMGTSEALRWLYAACTVDCQPFFESSDCTERYAIRQAVGVVVISETGALDPASEMLTRVVTALAFGNVVLAKPQAECAGTWSLLCDLLGVAGGPSERLFIVHGDSASNHSLREQIRKLSGDDIVECPAPPLRLDYSCPAIVLADADLGRCVRATVATALRGCGQTHDACHHVIVDRRVNTAFREELARRVVAIKPADPSSEDTLMGPMLSDPLLHAWSDFRALGVSEGAELLVDGERIRSPGESSLQSLGSSALFVSARIFARVTTDMQLVASVGRGPTILLMEASGPDEAFAVAESLGKLRHVSLFSRDARMLNQFRHHRRSRVVTLNPGSDLALWAKLRAHAAVLEVKSRTSEWSVVDASLGGTATEVRKEPAAEAPETRSLWPQLRDNKASRSSIAKA